MSTYSSSFPQFYDRFMGDYSELTTLTKQLVFTYLDKKKVPSPRLLELACGTGNILREFSSTFQLHGLDLSKGMLAIARKKVPSATYYHQNMVNFSVPGRFHVILCIFDSINHLHKFSEWKKVFASVARHLEPGGIFIFDMNTPYRLEALPDEPAYVTRLNDDLLCIKVHKGGDNLYYARFELFRNFTSDKRTLFEENVYESSFPSTQVEKELRKHFTIVKKVDPYRKRVIAKTGRMLYVCRRKEK